MNATKLRLGKLTIPAMPVTAAEAQLEDVREALRPARQVMIGSAPGTDDKT